MFVNQTGSRGLAAKVLPLKSPAYDNKATCEVAEASANAFKTWFIYPHAKLEPFYLHLHFSLAANCTQTYTCESTISRESDTNLERVPCREAISNRGGDRVDICAGNERATQRGGRSV